MPYSPCQRPFSARVRSRAFIALPIFVECRPVFRLTFRIRRRVVAIRVSLEKAFEGDNGNEDPTSDTDRGDFTGTSGLIRRTTTDPEDFPHFENCQGLLLDKDGMWSLVGHRAFEGYCVRFDNSP